LTEVQAAIPVILLALSIVAVLGAGIRNLIIVLALTGWVIYARTVRALTMALRDREFVTAARAVGCGSIRIMLRHILPQMVAPVTVVATLEIARMIILESALSFLGLGVQPPDLSWGLLLGEGNQYLLTSAWLSAFPGIAIAATVFSVNAVGDWLRGVLDPSMKRR
jgi:peptide/nickel transport system permease protein